MSKYDSGLFHGTGGVNSSSPINGTDFNTAGSSSVKKVESNIQLNDPHSMPQTDRPNTVIQSVKDGRVTTERYYGDDGKAYLDLDYTDHGNPKTHPHVPHEHDIWFDEKGKMHREKEVDIRK